MNSVERVLIGLCVFILGGVIGHQIGIAIGKIQDSRDLYSCTFDRITGPPFTVTALHLERGGSFVRAERDGRTFMLKRDQLQECIRETNHESDNL